MLSPGSTDVDGDTLTTTYDWKINGSAVVPTTSDRLVETEFAPEDEVACTVTVSDGTDSVSVTEWIDIYDDPIDNGWIQYPCTTTVSKGSRVTFYGRVYEPGITNTSGTKDFSSIRVDLGVGTAGTNPATSSSWTWTAATGNSGFNNGYDWEYQATYTVPSTASSGTYDVAFRFSTDNGLYWTYADRRFGWGHCGGSGSAYGGSNDGYDSADAGKLNRPVTKMN